MRATELLLVHEKYMYLLLKEQTHDSQTIWLYISYLFVC